MKIMFYYKSKTLEADATGGIPPKPHGNKSRKRSMHESAHADSASSVPVPGVKLSAVKSTSVFVQGS